MEDLDIIWALERWRTNEVDIKKHLIGNGGHIIATHKYFKDGDSDNKELVSAINTFSDVELLFMVGAVKHRGGDVDAYIDYRQLVVRYGLRAFQNVLLDKPIKLEETTNPQTYLDKVDFALCKFLITLTDTMDIRAIKLAEIINKTDGVV